LHCQTKASRRWLIWIKFCNQGPMLQT
jgi:hypothetical protein